MKHALFALALVAASPLSAKLTVLRAGPVGEIAKMAEANEVRVVFSEPMVAVGKIPKVVTAPFFHIAPPVRGSFRWSGTTTLIFTPDPKAPLPFATKFDVTIDATATALNGDTLGRADTFSFTTPTIRLLQTGWYRKGGRFDAPVVIGLVFNQPVDAETIGPHLQLRTKAHEFTVPTPPQSDPAYAAKIAAARAAASSDGAPVAYTFPAQWDRKRFPFSPARVVVETKPGVLPDTWLQVQLDDRLAKDFAIATGKEQAFTIQLAPTFFVDGIGCTVGCNPENYDPIRFRDDIAWERLRDAVHVTDVTDPAHPTPLQREKTAAPEWRSVTRVIGLDELGYSVPPAHTLRIRVDPTLQAEDGQTLGYAWTVDVDEWHKPAFLSFGDGNGVWESSGGPLLPFHARNLENVTQWTAPVSIDQLMPDLVKLEPGAFHNAPPGTKPVQRRLAPVPDKIQSYGLDLAPVLGANGLGFVWAAMAPGSPIPRAKIIDGETATPPAEATLVQVTNLGISVKDSPQNTLVLVTRLDDARPVAGAKVSIRTTDNKVFWTGTTDEHGIAVAPNTDLRVDRTKEKKPPNDEYEDDWTILNQLRFIVTAEKDGDMAYASSNWNDGIAPWDFDLGFSLREANPLLRGTIFSDRGVYKLGEEVHLKAMLRSDTPAGMQLLASGTPLEISVLDSHDKEIDKRTVQLGEWSSAEWTMTVPAGGVLGNYRLVGTIKGQRNSIDGTFLVAAYRRPEFRVDVGLTAPTTIAGTKLDGTVTARYLFGAPMASLPVKWTYTRTPLYDLPAPVYEHFSDSFSFLGSDPEEQYQKITIAGKEETLGADGTVKLSLDTVLKAGWPFEYQLEADVTDVSRQHIANRASFRVDPAPWYIGIKTPPYFADAAAGIDTAIIAAALDGTATPGVRVTLDLHRIQWNSVRQAAGNGFYNWETTRKEIPSGTWTINTQAQPAALHIPLKDGGEYVLIARASDAQGRSAVTRAWFYAVGAGYTAWAREDNNRIELVPEKETWKPGETARIMIKSPWEHATALLTTEREGVRSWTPFELTSTQQTVTVPITERDIPNIYVSVLLLKGRTKEGIEDESDPGKPSFRLGYVELQVQDASKRLAVDVKANREEYRPATKARVDVSVHDASGHAVRSEVTLWAVDYGVLSLTDYRTPDVLRSIYLNKALQVVNDDSRQKIVSRRVLTPKGETQGGGGGKDLGPGMLRKDFRVLAFWVGSIVTDRRGHAHTVVTLPESLTTYRIMAVAGDRDSRFGWAQNEIRINKPVLLTQTFPRFLALGDKARFGAVVHSQLKEGGAATVTIRSLDPSILEVTGEPRATVQVPAGGSVEARFEAVARAVGVARVQMSVSLNRETDAFQDEIPVRLLSPEETSAAYGEAKPTATEQLEVPADVVPSVGGLHLELASTAMVGLSAGAEYLVEYPYGCAEQRASGAMALMLTSDLGEAFALPGIDAKSGREQAQTTIQELYKFQCGDGGFAYWPGECSSESAYLTADILHVFQRAQKLQYDVSPDVLKHAYTYLDAQMKQPQPEDEGWWPSYTAWQAFAVKVLQEGGWNEDSNINRLYGYVDRMPVFAIAFLADADAQHRAELLRRIDNAILPEGSSAHVEELTDPYLLWFWNSNVRTTAIVLDTLVRLTDDEDTAAKVVRWLMQVRRKGRWGNTQENAWAMESLIDYYRRYEHETPNFTATVTLGQTTLARDEFRGRSTEAKGHDLPLARLSSGPVTFTRDGSGTLFYLMRLKYALTGIHHEGAERGFSIERHYSQTSVKAGDLVKVTLHIRNTKERRFVAITDPIPAGTEPVESWFATTASDLAEQQVREEEQADDWTAWWRRGGFDYVERHDDRVNLFATRLSEGVHDFTYVVRATTAGTFITAPASIEEMYEPEVFGRTATDIVEIRP
ncbi:MAG TPA: MG2 domain-containing protein [Thermoanaerobaculia bacterium]|nr:MG2 domain-containing protein [Thermoanaerobaculia bacterium]